MLKARKRGARASRARCLASRRTRLRRSSRHAKQGGVRRETPRTATGTVALPNSHDATCNQTASQSVAVSRTDSAGQVGRNMAGQKNQKRPLFLPISSFCLPSIGPRFVMVSQSASIQLKKWQFTCKCFEMKSLQFNPDQSWSKWVKLVSRQATAKPGPKRQRTGALQNLSAPRPSTVNAQRLGVRQSSAAFSPAQDKALICPQKIRLNRTKSHHFETIFFMLNFSGQ